MDKKQQKQKRNYLDDDILEKLKKKFDFGNGVDISIGYKVPGEEEVTTFAYTTKNPKIEIKTGGAKRLIEVEVSSIEQDNEKLLHFLHRKTV